MGQACLQSCQRTNSINIQSSMLREKDTQLELIQTTINQKRIKPGTLLRYPSSLNYVDNDSLDLGDEEINKNILLTRARFNNIDLDKQSLNEKQLGILNNSFNKPPYNSQTSSKRNSMRSSQSLSNDFREMIQNQQRKLIDYQYLNNNSPKVLQYQLIKQSEPYKMIPSERSERKKSYEYKREKQNRELLQNSKSQFYYSQRLNSNQNSEQFSQNSQRNNSFQRKEDDQQSMNSLINSNARPSLAVDLNQNSEVFTLKSRDKQKTYNHKGILKNKSLNKPITTSRKEKQQVRFTLIQLKVK